MIINDLNMNQQYVFTDVQCRMHDEQKIISKNGRIEMFGDNQFNFITKDHVINFSIKDKNQSKLIMDYFNRHWYCLANVTSCNNKIDNHIFFLHIGFFYNFQRWGEIPIIFNDHIKEKITKKYIKNKINNKELLQLLEENFILSDGQSKYIAYTSGKYYYDNEEEINMLSTEENNLEIIYNEDTLKRIKEKEKNKKESLVIYGKKFCFYLSLQKENSNNESKLYVEKVQNRKRELPMMRIAETTLEFNDYHSIVSNKVKETLESTKGYLDLWNQYSDQEGELLLEKVRKVGLITICRKDITINEDSSIHVPYIRLSKEAENLITNDSFLYFSDEPPIYLTDMTWKDYRKLSKEVEKYVSDINKGVHIRVISKKNDGFILKSDDGLLPDKEYVSLSILGNEQQISRREDARQRILSGQAANPALGLILEGQLTEEIGSYATRKKIEPLSSFVKEKIFSHKPTETQKNAIEIALNTPDIAIIQGPPGTGKTTVITAIIERLNEICNKQEKINGQVLITSFQHDAVRNVIERLSINSLPTIKFGKQERNGEEDLTSEKLIDNWCEDYINQLNKKNPELEEVEQRNELSKLHNIYLAYPSDENALKFLNCAKEINKDSEWNKKIDKLIELKSVRENENNKNLLTVIRRLRTTKEGFIDDGADNAYDLLKYLERIGINQNIEGNKKILKVLNEALSCDEKKPNEQLLNELRKVKLDLLEKCVPKPSYKKEIEDEDVTEIYSFLNQVIRQYKDEKSAILANLLRELRINRSEVEKSLEHYLFVYAATTQQSEGRDIQRAKDIKELNTHPEYETVIVDEAARVNPTDLLIPLTQAKKRIILVGDHRQLPHIYDEEVVESLKENEEDFDINNIKKSMFEYLLEKAKQLENIDKVPRTIVLDEQYRMHPVLGEFINDVFYKPYHEHFGSPLPADNYSQHLSKEDYPVEWYNFPDNYGRERKEGTSRARDCEADFIVEKIQTYINSEAGRGLTYGVITFYSEQVKNIQGKLKDKLGNEAEKIRVGSVDAFQGMEFDVIFLSVVRSHGSSPKVRNNKKEKSQKIDFNLLELNTKEINKEEDQYKEWLAYKNKVGIQNYGFLISENRLCVSLSRQKRLLIVVGNANIFHKDEWGRVAEICVPGMKRLYELCKKKDVIYDGYSESI